MDGTSEKCILNCDWQILREETTWEMWAWRGG